MDTAKLNIEYLEVDDLIMPEYGSRIWTDDILEKVEHSITEHGMVVPILINSAPNRKNIIIEGTLRVQVAKKLGLKSVPVVKANIPEVEKEKALGLKLNRLMAEWDHEKLMKNYSIEMLIDAGFSELDFSKINDSFATEDDEFNIEKALQTIKTPKTQKGDLIELGPHRILCANSSDESSIQTVVGNNKIDMIYNDFPYNIFLNYDGGISGKKKYGGKQTKDNKSDAEYASFIQKIIENCLEYAKPDCHIFSWCDQSYISTFQTLYPMLGIDFKRVCLWIKNVANVTPKVAFSKIYEPCIYGIRGMPFLSGNLNSFHEILNKEISNGNRLTDDILDLLEIWLVKKLPTAKYEHPTEKPPSLHEKPIRRCTRPGDNILDVFGGSGSTLIAAEQLNRTAFLIEWEPIFIDLIILRYETYTGRKAKKLN